MPFDYTQTVTIVYADCPWQYDNVRTGGSLTSGSAQQYPTLNIVELMDLPVGKVYTPSVLFLWATVPMGRTPYAVMEAWGYTYKTSVFWRKTGRKGIGYWFRNAVEVLMIGVKGNPPPPPFRSIRDNIIEAPVQAHSQKPEVFRELIETATAVYPQRRLVELFARTPAPGWVSYGLDLGHDLRQPPQLVQVAPESQLGLPFPEVGTPDSGGLLPALDAAAVPILDDRAG